MDTKSVTHFILLDFNKKIVKNYARANLKTANTNLNNAQLSVTVVQNQPNGKITVTF